MRRSIALAVVMLAWHAVAAAEAKAASPTAAAQQALPKFLLAVQERPSWASRFRVLVELGAGTSRERFWLNDFRRESNGFSGQVSSVPRVAEGFASASESRCCRSRSWTGRTKIRQLERSLGTFTSVLSGRACPLRKPRSSESIGESCAMCSNSAPRPNPSVKGTSTSGLRPLAAAPYLER